MGVEGGGRGAGGQGGRGAVRGPMWVTSRSSPSPASATDLLCSSACLPLESCRSIDTCSSTKRMHMRKRGRGKYDCSSVWSYVLESSDILACSSWSSCTCATVRGKPSTSEPRRCDGDASSSRSIVNTSMSPTSPPSSIIFFAWGELSSDDMTTGLPSSPRSHMM